MEIPFRSQFESSDYAFILSLESQDVVGAYDGDMCRLSVQATFKREPQQDIPLYPVILDLHGRLSLVNDSYMNSTILQPVETLPISLVLPNNPCYALLSFTFPRQYLQHIEEYRASQQGQDIMFGIQLWGTAAMVKPRPDVTEIPKYLQSHHYDVIRFEKISSEHTANPIRIARSTWIDRILTQLGHGHSILIELPLVRTPELPEVYKQAVTLLDVARRAFEQGDYKGAIRHARDVLEFFEKNSQGDQLTAFCKEHIEPVAGATKAEVLNRSFGAIRKITNASSHFDPHTPFIPDRASAMYAIEMLALNLRYIASILG